MAKHKAAVLLIKVMQVASVLGVRQTMAQVAVEVLTLLVLLEHQLLQEMAVLE
jgi:hypothetical protein